MIYPTNRKIIAAITALLFSTMACRAATRLIAPDTPTPLPPTATFVPTFTPIPPPTATPTPVVFESSCPLVVSQIIEDAVSDGEIVGGDENADEEVDYLVDYDVNGDQIESPLVFSVRDDLEDEQGDRATHEKIWQYFTRLIPAEYRGFVSGFSIFTDGEKNYLAAVNQSESDPEQWVLNVDIADSYEKTNLTYTLLHEYGHLLTLNAEQVVVSVPVYENPEDETIYQAEVSACPQYFPGEGCSNPDSFINEFFTRYWTYLFDEWQEIDQQADEDTYERMLDNFYDTYQDQFLTDYAPTSPAEDIAESFTFFILSPKPELNSIANEKILFFHEYPELLELRARILNQLCVEFPP